MLNDALLLRRYAETGDQAAFAEIVRRHIDAFFLAAVRRLGGDTHLAQDGVQQVLVALARKADAVSRHPVVTSWLYTATRHEAANVVRRERRRKAREQVNQAMYETISQSEPELDWSRIVPVLDDAIDTLGETDRAALLLRFVDGCAFRKIGGALAITEDAARMRVQRALDKLRASLAKRGIVSTGATLATSLAGNSLISAPAGLASTVIGAALAATPIAGPIAGVVSFMTASKVGQGITAVVLLALSVTTAAIEINARNAAEQSLADVVAANAKLDLHRQELPRKVALADSSLQESRAALAKLERAAADRSSAIAHDPIKAGNKFTRNERVLEAVRVFRDAMTHDPHAQLSHFATKRSEFTEIYSAFIKQHDLAEETATQLVENEVKRYEQFLDLRFAIDKMRPESLQPPEVAKLRQQIEDDLRASHVALLGDDGFRAFENFQRTKKARQFVDRLAGNTTVLGVPISGQQADLLIDAIANANPQIRSGTVAWIEGVEWDKVFVIASDILSEGQLIAFKTAAIPIGNKQRLERLAAKSTASR